MTSSKLHLTTYCDLNVLLNVQTDFQLWNPYYSLGCYLHNTFTQFESCFLIESFLWPNVFGQECRLRAGPYKKIAAWGAHPYILTDIECPLTWPTLLSNIK